MIRLFFQSSGNAHALRHEQKQKVVSGLGLMDRNGVEAIHQRLDNLEGELRRLGLMNDED